MRLFPEWPWRRRREKTLSAKGRSVVSGWVLAVLLAAALREGQGWIGITGSGLLMLLSGVVAAGSVLTLSNRAMQRLLFGERGLPSDAVVPTFIAALLSALFAVACGFDLAVRLAGGHHL